MPRGRRPYGQTPKQIEAIRFIRRQRNLHHGRRKSYFEIARLLNERNTKYPKRSKKHFSPPGGKVWYPASVKNILDRCAQQELSQREKKHLDCLNIPQAIQLWQSVDDPGQDGGFRAKRRRAIVAVLLFAGLRVSELCGLQYRDLPVKHGKNEIVIRRGKGGKSGVVHISQKLVSFLNDYIGSPKSRLRDTGYLFRNEAGKKPDRDQIYKIVRRIGRRQNRHFLHPHAMRHTYATILLWDTGDPHFVRRQLRHVSSATTDIYVGLIVTKLDENTPPEVYELLRCINPLRV